MLIFNKDKTFISHLQTVRRKNKYKCMERRWTGLTVFSMWFTMRWVWRCGKSWMKQSKSYDKGKCISGTCAIWHTSHEWPQSIIKPPSLRSHQGRHNSGSHSLSTDSEPDPQRPVYFLYLGLRRQCFSIGPLISIEITNHSPPHVWVSHNWQQYSCSLH